MKERLIKNYITSLFGCLIILLSGVLLYSGKLEWYGCSMLIILGVFLIGSKDKKLFEFIKIFKKEV